MSWKHVLGVIIGCTIVSGIVAYFNLEQTAHPPTTLKLLVCPKPEVCIYELSHKGETTLIVVSDYKYNVEILNK